MNNYPKIKITFLSRILLFLGTFAAVLQPYPAKAQPSLIETIQNSVSSVVSIESTITELAQNPKASAAMDKTTGRLIIVRNLRGAQIKRSGAGIIIDPQGLIVTNAHVVMNAGRVNVTLHNKQKVPGKVVWIVQGKDLAFISITPPVVLRPIYFANSQQLRLHDEVFTVGNSPILNETITSGNIIGIGIRSSDEKLNNSSNQLLQVNINLYKGDSGGPLLDRNGDLVGLMVAGQIKKDRSSFAIPSNEIREQYLLFLKTKDAPKIDHANTNK